MILIKQKLAVENRVKLPCKMIKQQNKKYLQILQRGQVIKYSLREAPQFIVVQRSAIYLTVWILKQLLKILLNTKKKCYGNAC